MECRGEEGVVFMGVAFRELPGGRSRWRLPQSRDREMQRSTHCGYCVHGTHLLPMDHDRQDVSTPATRCAAGIMVPTEQQCRRVGGLQPRADECRTFYGWPAAVTIECGAHRYGRIHHSARFESGCAAQCGEAGVMSPRAREREPHRIRPACWALGSSSYILSASIPTTGTPVPSRPFRA